MGNVDDAILQHRLQGVVKKITYESMRWPSHAEDIAQEACIAVAQALARFGDSVSNRKLWDEIHSAATRYIQRRVPIISIPGHVWEAHRGSEYPRVVSLEMIEKVL
jgi:hypothetical protein